VCACMQEYGKCLEKKDKYSARERTGPNVVKLQNVCGILEFLFNTLLYTLLLHTFRLIHLLAKGKKVKA